MTTMKTPDFFDKVPPIVIADPLAEFLGATEGGLLEYRYVGRRSEEGFGSICTSGRMKAWPE